MNNKLYATVTSDEGENFRTIAEIMTYMGHPMNHSSVRNYLLKIMEKFVKEYSTTWGVQLSSDNISTIAKDPMFQQGIADALHIIEGDRLSEEPNV